MTEDMEVVLHEHVLVPRELFVGLVKNTRDLIGSQQWRKGTTGSNDRKIDALEQEVAQAEHLLQHPHSFPERKPYEPADSYDALRKQFRSLDMLERNARKMLQHYQQRDAAQEREKLLVSQEALTSEREANQRLTEEVECLEGELEQYRRLVTEAQKANAFRESLKGASEAERIAVGSDARDWDKSIVNELAGVAS